MANKENCKDVIKKLRKTHSLESLAMICGVGFNCVYNWSRGANVPKLAAEKLKDMVKQGGC